jgi:hypothetical protein
MGSAQASDYLENLLIDSLFRGGCLTTAGAAGSTAVVNKGIWTALTAYVVGDIVVPHANMTGAGGKLLRCTGGGTSGSTNSLAVPNPGTTLADASVTWTAIATMPALNNLYVALFTVTPSDSGGGTEVTGGSYARVTVASTLANWAGTQSTGSTTASTGTGGATSNNAAITFPAPTADWGTVVAFGIFDNATSGNLLVWDALTASRTILNGDPAPLFSIAALAVTIA